MEYQAGSKMDGEVEEMVTGSGRQRFMLVMHDVGGLATNFGTNYDW